MEDENKKEETRIEEFGAALTDHQNSRIYTLTIIGQVEGHQVLPETCKTTKYEHVLPLLASIEESDEVDGLLLLLNTVGGDIEAGLAIAEMVAGMKKPTVSLVLGGGHSIGIPLAVAAKVSFIASSATMTVHPVRVNGLVLGAPQSFEYLMRMQDRISDFVIRHSKISAEKFQGWLRGRHDMATDIGTIVGAEEAVEAGLIDAVGSFSLAKQRLAKLCE